MNEVTRPARKAMARRIRNDERTVTIEDMRAGYCTPGAGAGCAEPVRNLATGRGAGCHGRGAPFDSPSAARTARSGRTGRGYQLEPAPPPLELPPPNPEPLELDENPPPELDDPKLDDESS